MSPAMKDRAGVSHGKSSMLGSTGTGKTAVLYHLLTESLETAELDPQKAAHELAPTFAHDLLEEIRHTTGDVVVRSKRGSAGNRPKTGETTYIQVKTADVQQAVEPLLRGWLVAFAPIVRCARMAEPLVSAIDDATDSNAISPSMCEGFGRLVRL